jgi:electron transport complex protein RnfC
VPQLIDKLSFKGGYRFRGFQGAPTDELVEIPLPPKTFVPIGSAGTAVVKPGDQVTAGQTVVQSDTGPHRQTVSPVGGTVAAVSDELIEVECNGDHTWSPVEGASAEWQDLSTDKIEDILLQTGSCCAVPGGIPTRHNTSALAPGDVHKIVVHDSGSEVYTASVAVLMQDRDASHLVAGLAVLQKMYSKAACHVVLGAESKALLQELATLNANGGAVVHTGSPKYPQHLESVLLGSLFDDAVSHDASAADYGALVMDVQALLQIRDAVILGKPNIDRVVALAGPGFTTNPHVRVRVGTPVEHVTGSRINLARISRIVCNSVMTGVQLADTAAPIGFDCTALIAIPMAGPEFLPFAKPGFRSDSFSFSFVSSLVRLPKTLDDNIHGEERACIGCGYCEEACPVGILPYSLHRYVQRNIIDEKLVRYGAFRCIDCNLCTYVCPSKIPLARLISDGKQALLDEGFSPAPAVESEESAQ